MKGSEDLVRIGQVLKSNGTDGELLISFRGMDPEEIDTDEPVFIYYDGLPVPFFILSLTPRGNGRALVKLNDIDSLKDADEAAGREVWAAGDEEGDEEDLDDLVGWEVLDENGRLRGIVKDIEDIPGNPCLVVEEGGEESLFPVNDDLLLSADPEARRISLRIPEGL